MNRSILSWCLYDLANTIFAMNMTSYYFPVWVVNDRGGKELAYSLSFGASMFLSAVLMPWVGRQSDKSRKRIPSLIGWTLGCVLLTGSLSWISSLVLALTVFAAANFCYQMAGVPYNALLPTVVSPHRMGRVSGYGVALGYSGTIIGLLATAPIASVWGRQATFFPTALLFLTLSLPCFFWVPEPASRAETAVPRRSSVPDKRLTGLLWASFWGLNSVSTVILFMSVYAKRAIGFSDPELHRFLMATTGAALLGSLGWGWLTDRIGGNRALGWVWTTWVLIFGLAIVSFHPALFWVVGCAAGIALGGTWVASRVLLVELVEPERVGEVFGLFGFVSRLSAILGPVIWGLVLWLGTPLGNLRYRLGMGSLLFFMLVGWWHYRQVSKRWS